MTRAILLIMALAAAPLFAAMDVTAYQITAFPAAVMVTFANGPESRGFSWQTDTSVAESEVRLVAGAAAPEDFESTPLVYTGTCVQVNSPTAYSHKVMVKGLQPGTVYSYRLGGAGCLEGTVGPNKYGPDPKAAEREKMLTQPDEEADLDIQSDLDASSNNMDVPDENSDVNESEQEPI